jgi:hypothetical protein
MVFLLFRAVELQRHEGVVARILGTSVRPVKRI